jgi:hypothetical protein
LHSRVPGLELRDEKKPRSMLYWMYLSTALFSGCSTIECDVRSLLGFYFQGETPWSALKCMVAFDSNNDSYNAGPFLDALLLENISCGPTGHKRMVDVAAPRGSQILLFSSFIWRFASLVSWLAFHTMFSQRLLGIYTLDSNTPPLAGKRVAFMFHVRRRL